MAANTYGVNLLDLPVEILQSVTAHFKAEEWARGPSQACRQFNNMHLPHIFVRPPYPREPPLEEVEDDTPAADAALAAYSAKVNEIVVAALTWLAKRMGPATSFLDMYFRTHAGIAASRADNELIQAFLASASQSLEGLQQLKCLICHIFSIGGEGIRPFQEWLLEHASGLEALDIWLTSPVDAAVISFRHMKHLRLRGGCFVNARLDAGIQLPLLETLYLEGHGLHSVLDEVNLLQCAHFTHLVLDRMVVVHLSMGPACKLEVRLEDLCDLWEELWSSPMRPLLSRAHHVNAWCEEQFANDARNMFGSLPCTEMLHLAWPQPSNPETGDFVEDTVTEGADSLLTNCMPANGQPFGSLKILRITAFNMVCTLPAKLPSLEELVILADNVLEMHFEDPVATASALKTFYMFGQPLITDSLDMLAMAGSLVGRGLMLGAVSAPGKTVAFDQGSSCIYLKPAMAPDEPILELFFTVQKLVSGCRCKACFRCLQTASCVPGFFPGRPFSRL